MYLHYDQVRILDEPFPMPERVNYRREYYDVYIGRPSPFGNPVRHGVLNCPICGGAHAERGDTLPCFETYLRTRYETDKAFAAQIEGLRGKRLGCWCPKSAPCHGDVIVKFLLEDRA